MKRISFFYVVSFLSISGLLFASVSYAAKGEELLALSIAAAQEAQEAVDVGQKIILDEDFAPQDFGLTGVGILPTSPFYFLKGIRRTVQSAFTFDPVAEAELKIRFSAEKLLETKAVAGTEGASSDDITFALENFKGELQRVTDRTKDAADGLEEGKAVELTKKLMDFTIKCQKSLGKIEKTLPPELFENMKLAKEKTSETFGGAFDLVEPEKVTKELVSVLETQKGSEFKDFKNIEILKEIEEKAPEQAKDAIRLAQGQALTRLQGELEKLQFAKRAVFEDFVREIGGSGVQQLEIITDLEAQPLSADVREVLAGVKEEALSKTDKRLQTLTQSQQEKFLEHLAQGEIKNVKVLKELEQNVSKGVLQGILQAKERAKGGIVEKVKTGEFQEKGKQKLFGELEQSHDAGSLAVLDEIEALIPSDKKAFFSDLKKKAVVEIKRDIDRAGTASQRQVIFAALAGDHPEQVGVINRFQKEVDTSFDFGSIWEGMRRAQAERFEMRTESIKDRERLGRLEEEFGKQKEEFKEFRQFEDLFRTRRNVFDSPERAQAQIREAEERIAELDKIIDSLPFDVSFEGGKFDPFLAEIERLLEVAGHKLKAAREFVSQQPGRAFGFANAATDIARHGIRMAEEYKSGRKEVRCPFFFPPPPNFCLNGRVVSDIDQNGCQLPPRCEFVEQCPIPSFPPFNFCANGRIVYEKSPQGCPLPPRCEEFRTCPLIVDPKPCAEGSYRDGFYRDGCFVYGECRIAEKQYFSCGGAAGLICPNGYRCEMPARTAVQSGGPTPTFPDAMGKCIPTEEKPITCQAYWSGFVWRPETNSCVKEGTSGCSDPFVFHTQEECEKANKITICPAMPTVTDCPAGQRKVVTFSSPQCGIYYGCESGEPIGKPQCSDGIDNDNDGLIDYPKDTGCYGADDGTETPYVGGSCFSYTTQTSCQTSGCRWYANHHDGTHCDDAAHGQSATNRCVYYTQSTCDADTICKWVSGFGCGSKAQCNDGIDNDNDGLIDHPKDTGCYDAFDNDEASTAGAYCGDKMCSGSETATSCPTDCGGGAFTCNNNKVCESNENYTSCPGDCGGATCNPEMCYDAKYCTDGIDNDNDGFIDGKDPGCGGATGGYCGDKVCNNGETATSCASDCGGGTTGVPSPGPTALTFALGSTSVVFNWTDNSFEESNTIEERMMGGTTWSIIGSIGPVTVATGSYTYPNRAPGSYDYRVTACNMAGCSIPSNSVTVTYGGTTTPPPPPPTTKPQCSDGIDNDNDGLIDHPKDTGCYGTDDNDEAMTGTATCSPETCYDAVYCADGKDNDADGFIDSADPGCGGSTTFTCDNDKICESNENYTSCSGDCGGATCGVPEACYDQKYCTDGIDNDSDGFIDSKDPGCGITTVSCGDKVCSSSESGTSCPGDCGGSTSGTCSTTPSACTTQSACTGAAYFWCNGACYGTQASCPTSSTYCNSNNICDSGETATSCPSDCGGSTTTSSCGDHICNGSETSATCSVDCGTTCATGYYWDTATSMCKPSSTSVCGNGACESSETATSCPADCGTTTTTTGTCDGTADSSQSNCLAVSGCTWNATGNYCYPSSGASLYNLFTPFLKLFGF